MTKTDKTKHDICIASIKRSTIRPYDFKWTKFYESNCDFPYSELTLILTDTELIICSTVIDDNNYSILTTQRLITREKGIEVIGNIVDAVDKLYGDFKGNNDEAFTFGVVQLCNSAELKYFIEIGKASMIMINGVRTLIRLNQTENKS